MHNTTFKRGALAWLYMPVISAIGRLKQERRIAASGGQPEEHSEFNASLNM